MAAVKSQLWRSGITDSGDTKLSSVTFHHLSFLCDLLVCLPVD